MEAKKKLNETYYFLNALKVNKERPDEFDYNLSAFLAALRGILDVMLYDFAEKYQLGFTRDDRFTFRNLKGSAKRQNKIDALQFLKWWSSQLDYFRKNPLYAKRNIIVHRGYPPTTRVHRLYISDAVTLSSSFYIPQQPAGFQGEPQVSEFAISPGSSAGSQGVSNIGSSAIPPSAIGQIETKVEVSFPDFPHQDALDVCQQACSNMKTIVEYAKKNFWIKP